MIATPECNRRRAIQESILRDLAIRFEAAPDLPLLWQHIVYGFSTAATPYSEEEIRAAVTDLVERGLADVENTPGLGAMSEKGYRATPEGRDFHAARCPWNLVDRFSRVP